MDPLSFLQSFIFHLLLHVINPSVSLIQYVASSIIGLLASSFSMRFSIIKHLPRCRGYNNEAATTTYKNIVWRVLLCRRPSLAYMVTDSSRKMMAWKTHFSRQKLSAPIFLCLCVSSLDVKGGAPEVGKQQPDYYCQFQSLHRWFHIGAIQTDFVFHATWIWDNCLFRASEFVNGVL